MKNFSRVLKFIIENRQDIEHSSNEHLALQLYKFFYGQSCANCVSELDAVTSDSPCFDCIENGRISHKNWSPK